jgi:hypothetical protein
VRPQQKGRAFEKEFAARHGLSTVPGSGATPRFKLDVGSVDLLLSLKWTSAESFRITAADVRETLAGAGGPGGRGQVGLLVARISGLGEEIVIGRESDVFSLLRGDTAVTLRPGARATKLAAADPLAYLR